MDWSNQKQTSRTFMQLPQPKDKIECQYVYIDGSLRNLRTKSMTLPKEPIRAEELPVMEFCGSATDFDIGNVADYYAHPKKIYSDPFRGGNNKVIYCETWNREGVPTFANNRHRLRMAEEKTISEVSLFSFYQSYTLLRRDGKPLSFKEEAFTSDSKSGFLCGRIIAESHYKACLYSGIKMTSLEPASSQGQWKYSIGPSTSVDVGDRVWMSKYLLLRVAEDFGVAVTFDSAYERSCLNHLSASIEFSTDHLIQPHRQRIIDNLFLKFGNNENPLKIMTPKNKIILKDIQSDIDPYSIFTRLLEVISR